MAAESSITQPHGSDAATFPGQRRRTVLLIVAGLLPCLGSVIFGLRPQPQPPLVVTKSRPSLIFATYLYHHGEEPVAAEATLQSEFRFRNDGAAAVTIDRVDRSCGCMTPQWTKQVAPGEIGSLMVPIQTLNQSPGEHEYTLTVHYRDPQPRQTTLTIKATFPEKMVVVQPSALYMSQSTSQPIPLKISISDFRDSTLNVLGVESTAWFVSAAASREPASGIVQTAWSPDEDVATATIRVRGEVAGDIPAGRHDVLIAATTDDPEFPVIVVPIQINGPSYPEGQAPVVSPSQISFVVAPDESVRRNATVKVIMPQGWNVSHATTWPEQLTAEFDEGANVSDFEKMVNVNIRLTEQPAANVADGIVQLVANEGKDLVTIKVRFVRP